MSNKPRKKFRDTKVGKFLGKVAPSILGVAGDLLPDAGVLGIVKNLIEKDDSISPQTLVVDANGQLGWPD